MSVNFSPFIAELHTTARSMSMGMSFGDVPYIKSEGCWKFGHLEEERKTRRRGGGEHRGAQGEAGKKLL